MRTFIRKIFILPIKLYQLTIARIVPHHCAFVPSCSNYCIQAIKTHGVFVGFKMGFVRILKCNPKNNGKVDNVIPNIKGDFKWLI